MPRERLSSEDAADHPTRTVDSTRASAWIFRFAVAIAASPILVAAIRNGLAGWYPSADAAITAVRTRDVFSTHPPLIGLPAFPSTVTHVDYAYLGAPVNDVLALPVKLFGVSWGLLLGMAAVNIAAFVTTMWLVRRRVGHRLATLACVFGAALLWAVGSQALVDPTPVEAGIIVLIAFYASCWSLADGDHVGLIPLAVTGNFLVLAHLKFIVVVPVVGAVAVVAWLIGVFRRRRSSIDDDRSSTPGVRRNVLGAIAVTVVFWLPTVVQQFMPSGGNITHLVQGVRTSAGQTAGPSGWRQLTDAIGVVSSPVVASPFWSRQAFAHPRFTVFGPRLSFVEGALGLAIVVGIVVVLFVRAIRTGDRTSWSGLVIAVMVWTSWVISAFVQPQHGWPHRYFQALWPLAMFVWLVIVLALVRSTGGLVNVRRPDLRNAVAGLALVVIAVFAALAFPIANFGSATSQEAIPVARQLAREAQRVPARGGPVQITYSMAVWPYVSDVILGLQESGVDFRFDIPWALRTYGAHRALPADRSKVRRIIDISSNPRNLHGSVVIAMTANLRESPRTYEAVYDALRKWEMRTRELGIPADAPYSSAERRFIETSFNSRLADAKRKGTSIFDDADLVDGLLKGGSRSLVDLIDVPGVTRRQKLDWLADQKEVLGDSSVFVTMRTVPAG